MTTLANTSRMSDVDSAANQRWWWVMDSVLDEIEQDLVREAETVEGQDGALVRAVSREPSLGPAARALMVDRLRLVGRTRRLRTVIGFVMGDDSQASAVGQEFQKVSTEIDRLHDRIRTVLQGNRAP